MHEIITTKMFYLGVGLFAGQFALNPSVETIKMIIIEFAIFIVASLIGIGIKFATLQRKKIETSTSDKIVIAFLGFATALLADYFLVIYAKDSQFSIFAELYKLRAVVIVFTAFLGEMILDNIEKKYPSIFNRGVDKLLGKDNEETN